MSADAGGILVRSRVFRAPKAGHRDYEYEDASALTRHDALPFRAAVADGATESAFARIWAECLVEEWVAHPSLTEAQFREHLPTLQALWKREAESGVRDVPWYAAAKREQGAFATFLGLSLNSDGTCKALAVGDSCLFVLSEDNGQLSWPLTEPDQFTFTPDLVPSLSGRPPVSVRTWSGTWAPRDTFVLATDAAAAWLMRMGPAQAINLTEDDFPARLDDARSARMIRNDDVTLIVLEIADAK